MFFKAYHAREAKFVRERAMTDTRFDCAALEAILEAHRDLPGAMLPVLHAVQDHYGYVPAAALPRIAQALNVSRAEVHGVVTYYHHFRDQAVAGAVVQICRAEACQALGADALVQHAQKSLRCSFHESTADGTIALEPVFCLGQCAVGPAVMVGDTLHARVTPERFDRLIEDVRSVPA